MKVLEFTLAVAADKSIITKEEKLPHFYPYLHRHNEIQLTWIIEGEGTLVTGNSMRSFKSNEIFWIGAKQSHVFKGGPSCHKTVENRKTHSIDIFFNMGSQLSSLFFLPEMKQIKTFIEQHHNGFKIPANQVATVSEKMHLIRNSSGVDQFMVFIELLKLLMLFDGLEVLTAESDHVQCNEAEGLRIASIYNFVMKNYKEQITLEQVAKLAYMTPHAFCRYFKKHTHTTLVCFVNQVRINEACKQLTANKNDTIACIAYNAGFNSITNFNRVFKSVVKKSPKEYLESYMRQVI